MKSPLQWAVSHQRARPLIAAKMRLFRGPSTFHTALLVCWKSPRVLARAEILSFLHLCHPTHFSVIQATHKPTVRIKHKCCLCFGATQFQTSKPARLDVIYLKNIIKTHHLALQLALTCTSSIALLYTHLALACAIPNVHTCNKGCDLLILRHFHSTSLFSFNVDHPSCWTSLQTFNFIVGLVSPTLPAQRH